MHPSPTCVVPLRAGGSRPPFFCIHSLEGSIDRFRELATELGPHQPFYGVRSPLLDGDWRYAASLEDLAAHYAGQVRTVQPHGPYYLGGYSMGGRVAFAMAQHLKAQDQPVGLLALLDSRSYIGRRLPEASVRLRRYTEILANSDNAGRIQFVKSQLQRRRNKLVNLFRRRYFDYKLSRRRPTSRPSVPSSRMIIHVHHEMDLRYQPMPYDGRAILIKVDKSFLHSDVHDGWRRVMTGDYNEHVAPGRHLTLLTQPHVATVASVLSSRLEEAAEAMSDYPRARN